MVYRVVELATNICLFTSRDEVLQRKFPSQDIEKNESPLQRSLRSMCARGGVLH